ncbi:myb/SANT-like DNA-binding domain-containing protein 3 [Periplaneta americana]|uniref:myb/SANT-like DNA-binding domain-containing protein 3 n=1 Tax=Periplaneta americana TaxID=6978 RepID=UPI0037E7B336
MEVKKRIRSSNFSEAEKHILLEVISKYIKIIQDKKTDGQTVEEKRKGWLQIERDFNARNLVARPWAILKTKWENMKTEARRQYAASKVERLKTGGAPYKSPVENELVEKVKTLIGATLDGLQSPYDCDADYAIEIAAVENSVPSLVNNPAEEPSSASSTSCSFPPKGQNFDLIFDSGLENVEVALEPGEQNWTQWTSTQLGQPISESPKFPVSEEPTSSVTSVSQAVTNTATTEETPAKNSTQISRRRPHLRKPEKSNRLLAAKLELLELTMRHANEKAAMREELFKEQMKQEKLKTRILLLQLRKAKKHL